MEDAINGYTTLFNNITTITQLLTQLQTTFNFFGYISSNNIVIFDSIVQAPLPDFATYISTLSKTINTFTTAISTLQLPSTVDMQVINQQIYNNAIASLANWLPLHLVTIKNTPFLTYLNYPSQDPNRLRFNANFQMFATYYYLISAFST